MKPCRYRPPPTFHNLANVASPPCGQAAVLAVLGPYDWELCLEHARAFRSSGRLAPDELAALAAVEETLRKNDILEDAAKECDAEAQRAVERAERGDPSEVHGQRQGAEWSAKAIRRLKVPVGLP